MNFTDQQKELLYHHCHPKVYGCADENHVGCVDLLGFEEFRALLNRLDAAEYALWRYAIVPDEYLTSGIREAVEIWKKASGK